MVWLNNNRTVVAVVVVLVLAVLVSPSSYAGIYTALGVVVALVSIAFYGLGALWFWRELNRKDKPKGDENV